MPTETTPQPKYKICTKNCQKHGAYDGDTCGKAHWSFIPPLGKRCYFSLLEGQMELAQSQPSGIKKKNEFAKSMGYVNEFHRRTRLGLPITQTPAKCTEPIVIDFQAARAAKEKTERKETLDRICHLADHIK